MSKRQSDSCSTEHSKRGSGTQPNTFDISYVPIRSISMAQKELTYSTSAFTWKKNNALQTCTDTGVGDCPVCLGDRYSCHAEECQLCCEPKTCGPDFGTCPFVPGMGAQTDPICEFSTLSCRCIGECGTSKECRLAGNCGTTGMECLCEEKSCNTTGQCIVVEDDTGEYTGECVDGNEESCQLTELACRCRKDNQNYYTEKMTTHSAKTYSKQSLKGPHDTTLYVNSIKSFPTVADMTGTEKKVVANGKNLKLRQTTNDRRESNFKHETERIRKPHACYKETCGVCFEDDMLLKNENVFADELVLKHRRESTFKSTNNENYEESQSVKGTQECKCGEDGECRQAKSIHHDKQEVLEKLDEQEDLDETEETFHDVIEETDDEVRPDKRIHITEEIRPDSVRSSKHVIRNVATSVRPFNKPYCGCNDRLQKSGSHRLVLCECLTTSGGCIVPTKCSKSSTRKECFHENDEILILHLANSKKCNKCSAFNQGQNKFEILR